MNSEASSEVTDLAMNGHWAIPCFLHTEGWQHRRGDVLLPAESRNHEPTPKASSDAGDEHCAVCDLPIQPKPVHCLQCNRAVSFWRGTPFDYRHTPAPPGPWYEWHSYEVEQGLVKMR